MADEPITKKQLDLEPRIKKFRAKKIPNAYVVSQFYGFQPIDLPAITKEDKELACKIRGTCTYEHDDLPTTEESIALLRTYKHRNFEEQDPVMLFSEGSAKGVVRKSKRGEKTLQLHIIGSSKSITEAILIKTALAILRDEGIRNPMVEINTVGGREALGTFLRELTNYYRKHINDMDTSCRQLFKDGPHALLACNTTLDDNMRIHAPSPFNHLLDEDRNHLKEIIEFLDEEEIEYDMNKDILGNPHYSSDTIFAIKDSKSGEVFATGCRYNNLAKQTVHRKGIPGGTVTIRLAAQPKHVSLTQIPNPEASKFYFVHLGNDARRRSLRILEQLREANIHVHQALIRDKLSTQLDKAKRLKIPYVIILGQKEVQDETIIIRDTLSHSQESVPMKKLVAYLKKLQ